MPNAAYEMAVFERVVARRSFAAAADDIGISASAVSKLIARLERRLGVRLLNRTTRRLSLTTEGETYLRRSQEILAVIEAAEAEIASGRVMPRGHLRVHAPPVMITDHFAPALPAFLAKHPNITIEFLVANRVVDLIAENIDVSMRTGQLADSSLVAHKVVDLSQIVCASPDYLKRHGIPLMPNDLTSHRCLSLTSMSVPTTWEFVEAGEMINVEVNGPLGADSSDVLVGLATAGLGIVRLGELAVAKSLMNGALVRLLSDVQLHHGYPLWALLPPGKQRLPKVKVFLEFLTGCLGRTPWRATLAAASQPSEAE